MVEEGRPSKEVQMEQSMWVMKIFDGAGNPPCLLVQGWRLQVVFEKIRKCVAKSVQVD